MSDADTAYELAKAKIAEAKRTGATELDFSGEAFRALDRLPPEIQSLIRLQRLNLRNTQITDLAPLAGLTGLQSLGLNNTQITDLAPLAGLTGLQHLDLGNTKITDFTPLAGLTGLQSLNLNSTMIADVTPLEKLKGLRFLSLTHTRIADVAPLAILTAMQLLFLNETLITDIAPLISMTDILVINVADTQVTDLRPIAMMNKLGTQGVIGHMGGAMIVSEPLRFQNTSATKRDKRLAELAQIEDDEERTRETLAYLRSLPPWPEPYTPAATPDGSPPQPIGGEQEEACIPAEKAAPLIVGIVDNKLIARAPATPLTDDKHARARQAWAALQNSLDDLADMRPRIDNQMPALDKVLRRLDDALAQDYEAANQIELGFLGERVIAQAQAADETMVASDAAELKTFAAALAVFLERFPDWKAYRDDDTATAPPAPLAPSLLPEIDAIFDDLMDRDEIDQIIPQKLRQQTEDLRNEPENPRLLRGFLDSANNVLGKLAEAALAGGRWVIGEAKDWGGRYWRSVKTISAGAAGLITVGKVTGLSQTAREFFRRNAEPLQRLAQENPEEFGWLLKFLSLL